MVQLGFSSIQGSKSEMFRNQDKQTKMYFRSFDIVPRKLKKIDNSWAGVFNSEILPVLMRIEDQFDDFFDSSMGRPNFPVAALNGILLLKHEFDLTDEETVDQFNFNILWHKALGVSSYDCNICRKTIYNYQKKLNESHKHQDLFNAITDEIISMAKLKISRQRLDSVHIKSNMAELGRVRLFCRTIEMFLKDLQKDNPKQFDLIDSDLVSRYLDREGYFCDPKPTETKHRLTEAAADLDFLVTGFESVEDVTKMESYQLMKRLLSEQVEVSETHELELIKKPSSDSLQNPSDPDAGYSGHKGKGYQAQVSETFDEENPFEVITSVQVESACESDSSALEPMMKELEATGRKPEELQADTSYGGQENYEKARDRGIELIAPVPGGRQTEGITLDDFEFESDRPFLKRCPDGKEPQSQRYRKSRNTGKADFDIVSQCGGCPHYDECPGKLLKNGIRRVQWKKKTYELAKRRQYQKTSEFKERYKKRSGIEATFSQLGNTHGGKRLRVRGFPAVRGVTILKMIAINVHRYVKFQRNQLRGDESPRKTGIFSSLYSLFQNISHFLNSKLDRIEVWVSSPCK